LVIRCATLRWIGRVDGVLCLALAFNGNLGDVEAHCKCVLVLLLLAAIFLLFIVLILVLALLLVVHFVAQSLGIVPLQIQLDHLEDSPLHVLGPGLVLLLELDAFNDPIGIVKLAATFQQALLVRWNLFRLEDAHWLNLLLILDGFIQLASSDLAQAQLGMTFRAKGDLGLCLNAGDGLLLGICLALFVLGNEAGGNLGIVLELVGAARLEGWGPHFLLLSIRVLFIAVEWRSEPVLVLFGQGHIAEEAEANGHQQEKWSHFVSSVSPRCVDGS